MTSTSTSFHRLTWDSNAFGYSVAAITLSSASSELLSNVLQEMKDENIRLAYWFIQPNDILSSQTAAANNGTLIDEKMTYMMNLPTDVPKISSEIKSSLFSETTDSLLTLILQSGICSRFHTDQHFKHGEYKILYKEWLRKSLNAEKADEVFTYIVDNKEVGIITLEKKEKKSIIGLLAVDSSYRNMHIGSKLMFAAMSKAKEWECTTIEVVTQKANKAACAFYEKIGFTVKKQENIYHFWL